MLWVKMDLRFFRGPDGDASVTFVFRLLLDSVFQLSLGYSFGAGFEPLFDHSTPIKKLATATSAKVPRGLSVALSRTTVAVSAKSCCTLPPNSRALPLSWRGVAQGIACRVLYFAGDFLNRSSCFCIHLNIRDC